ncbi:hypothetical protein TeGR_g262 [Tetraparma gracilis]|uniref:Uncharacterized protein n=1 Tax=Tetraparma gracilis TaxID=2962635 RepID=A0ABQ6MLF0_9STRA|nr:hypothetical protein TeGR_g262 [Tetraparma gracilis]
MALPPTNAQQAQQQQQQYSMPQQQQQQQQQQFLMPQPLQLTPQQLQYLQQQQAIQLASFQQQQMPLTPELQAQLTMQIQQGLWGAPPQQPMGGAAPPPQLDEHEGQVLVNVPVYGGGGTVMTEYKGKMISVEVPREAKGGSSLWVDVPMLYR